MKDHGPFTRYTSHQAADGSLAAMLVWKEKDDPSSKAKSHAAGNVGWRPSGMARKTPAIR